MKRRRRRTRKSGPGLDCGAAAANARERQSKRNVMLDGNNKNDNNNPILMTPPVMTIFRRVKPEVVRQEDDELTFRLAARDEKFLALFWKRCRCDCSN